MGILKQAAFICIGIVLFSRLKTWLTPRLPVNLDGYCHPAFQRVADKFRENVESGMETAGATIAVYHKGVLVVDMWGGYADVESQRPWAEDTMTMGFSATKGIAAVMAATIVEKGQLDYKRLVKDYWPEFGQNGKDNVTVEMLLSHQAGLAALDETLSVFDSRDDPEKYERVLAQQKPLWPPGTAHGYHTATYGSYLDTLFKKVDPKGRNTAEIFYEDIAKPFELDMFMNTPLEQNYRVARMYVDPMWQMLLKCMVIPRYRSMMTTMMDTNSIFYRSSMSIKEFIDGGVLVHNDPAVRSIPCSCAHATGAARGFAKLYGIVANGGDYNGKRFLSMETIQKLATPLASGKDASLQAETTFGPGTALTKNSEGFTMVGHTGYGGQNAYADLKNELGIAYLTNSISIYGYGDDPRFVSLEKEIYASLKGYIATLDKK